MSTSTGRVVLAGNAGDPHLQRVVQELDALGVESAVVDFERFGTTMEVESTLSSDGAVVTRLSCPGSTLSSTDVGALWLRRAYPPAVVEQVSDPGDRTFARNEWRVAADAFAAALPAERVLNQPGAERAATKVRQLAAAARSGLRIPATMVTSSPAAARSFVERHRGRVIHKGLTAPPHAFLETRRWSDADAGNLDLLSLAPIMLQEEIVGPADLRVTVAGRRVYAALIPSSGAGVDSRLDMSSSYRPFDLDDRLAAQLQELLHRLGLAMGTIDLKLLDSGECVFFEVNPQGQFLYIEIMTGQPIARGLAATLVETARQTGLPARVPLR
jgi:hypothetical protein